MDHLARLAANPPIEALRYVLENYWVREDRGWINARLERERAILLEKYERRAAAGRLGGRAKSSNARAMLQQCSSNQNQNQNQNEEINHASHDSGASQARRHEPCPFSAIRELWIEVLPELKQPIGAEHWTDARKAVLRARWRDQLPDLAAWRECFELIRKSPFLMGQVATKGRRPFQADLFWVAKPENLLKIYEGKYHA
jgi:hypothetical protein